MICNMNNEELQGLTGVHDQAGPYELESPILEYDEFIEEAYYEYITVKVMLPMDNEYYKVDVIGRKTYIDGNSIGSCNKNPLL